MPITFERSVAALSQGVSNGLHTGAQLYVSRGRVVLADVAVGEARPGVAMTPDSLNLWLSSTKPVAAVAIAQLWERGLLELDDPIVRFIPEFAQNGKEGITIRHILTHTSGFRVPPRSEEQPWEKIIAEMCAARLEVGWTPGRKAGYHPASSWYILGEIVRRLDARDYSRYVREMIFEPIGMRHCWVGMPQDVFSRYGDRIAVMQDTAKAPPESLNVEKIATSCRPGSSGYGPIRELGWFYEMLMNRGRVRTEALGLRAEGENDPISQSLVLSPQSVEAVTARHRVGMMDVTFKTQIDWGLGFLINSAVPSAELPYGYGAQASPRTFGHGGAQSSGAFCDPERGIVVAYAFNGRPGEAKHHERRRALLEAVEEDLANATP